MLETQRLFSYSRHRNPRKDSKQLDKAEFPNQSMASPVSAGARISLLTLFLLLASGSQILLADGGRIQGEVVDGTTGKPDANQTLQLLLPTGGMQQIGTTTTDADGRFVFPQNNIETSAFYLLQATYRGVDYHAPIQFDSNGRAIINLTVYDSTESASALRIQSARLIVSAEGDKVHVQEMFAVRNSVTPPRAYVNPDGTFHFHLSKVAGEPTAAAVGMMNMPLPQPVTPGKSAGDYSIQYPLRPGMNVLMVAYDADYAGGQLELGDSVEYPIDTAELFVSPPTLSVSSSLFKPAGTDTETGSSTYTAENLKGGELLAARVSGEAAPAQAESEQASSDVKILPNSLTRLGVPLLACFLLVLLWALGVRVAKEWPLWKAQHSSDPAHKELEAQMDALFNSLADLDELFAAGKVPEQPYWKERLELKARLVVALKKAPPSLLESYAIRHISR
jgi:5-hydroxyisourate hydrolase-like protein (transthyretin family)